MRPGDPGFGEAVFVIRTSAAGEDDWGDPIPGGVESRTELPNCAVAPLKSDESSSTDGPRLIDGWSVFAPLGSDVRAGDALEVRGEVYPVDGSPGVWLNPYSAAHPSGVEVICRRS